MRSWFRPATAIGSNWIEPSLRSTSSTPSGPPARERAGARKCRATRKRRAAEAVTFTGRALAARASRHVPVAVDATAGVSPAMRRPISSTLSRSTTSESRPSYMTTMRSLSASISSRSSLRRTTAAPAAAASRRYECTVATAETSSPPGGGPAEGNFHLPGKLAGDHDLLEIPAGQVRRRRVGPRRPDVEVRDRLLGARAHPAQPQERPERVPPVRAQLEVHREREAGGDAGPEPVLGDVADAGV